MGDLSIKDLVGLRVLYRVLREGYDPHEDYEFTILESSPSGLRIKVRDELSGKMFWTDPWRFELVEVLNAEVSMEIVGDGAGDSRGGDAGQG